jgi:hypothetical protein
MSFGREGFFETSELAVNIATNDRIKKKKVLPFAIPITEPAIGCSNFFIGGRACTQAGEMLPYHHVLLFLNCLKE